MIPLYLSGKTVTITVSERDIVTDTVASTTVDRDVHGEYSIEKVYLKSGRVITITDRENQIKLQG